MGSDIHGFVEGRATYRMLNDDDVGWDAVIELDLLYGSCQYVTTWRR